MGGALNLENKTSKTRAEDVWKILEFSLLHFLKAYEKVYKTCFLSACFLFK